MRSLARVLVVALACLPGLARAQEKAGVAAAVEGRVELTRELPQSEGRPVESGEDIYVRDLLESGARSGMQVVLLDETVFTLGPHSTIRIDEFVYDPSTDAGEISAEVAKGVFRFVTGRIADREPEAVDTRFSVGSIGIRGTLVAGVARSDRALAILLGPGPNDPGGRRPGAFEAENAGASEWVRTPGWGAELRPGEAPEVYEVDPALIEEIRTVLDDPTGVDPASLPLLRDWLDEAADRADTDVEDERRDALRDKPLTRPARPPPTPSKTRPRRGGRHGH